VGSPAADDRSVGWLPVQFFPALAVTRLNGSGAGFVCPTIWAQTSPTFELVPGDVNEFPPSVTLGASAAAFYQQDTRGQIGRSFDRVGRRNLGVPSERA